MRLVVRKSKWFRFWFDEWHVGLSDLFVCESGLANWFDIPEEAVAIRFHVRNRPSKYTIRLEWNERWTCYDFPGRVSIGVLPTTMRYLVRLAERRPTIYVEVEWK